MKNKITLAAVLLTVLALPSCRWGKKDETVTEVRTYKVHETRPTNSKEVVTAEEAGYAPEDAGYDEDSRLA